MVKQKDSEIFDALEDLTLDELIDLHTVRFGHVLDLFSRRSEEGLSALIQEALKTGIPVPPSPDLPDGAII